MKKIKILILVTIILSTLLMSGCKYSWSVAYPVSENQSIIFAECDNLCINTNVLITARSESNPAKGNVFIFAGKMYCTCK